MRLSFLLLQGTASPFFAELARSLQGRGHAVQKVNYCGGDVAYSIDGIQHVFDRPVEELTRWYESLLDEAKVTDIVMFGDCRPVHQPVHALAEARGVRVRVFEEGYVRPNWITLEHYGVNGRSLLSREPDRLLRNPEHIPPVPVSLATGYDLRVRAFHDIRYRLANALLAWRFPHYKSHRPRNGLVEYAGLAIGMAKAKSRERNANDVIARLVSGKHHYYVVPLQLNSDAQVVHHSRFAGVLEFATEVLKTFALNAPQDSLIVFKMHPLDTGLVDYRSSLRNLAFELGIEDRVLYVQAGHLPTLLEHSAGVVVINSTVGLSALHHGKPLVVLGTAVYDMEGMTWQGTLDDFWHEGTAPDRALYQKFLEYIVHHTQINGDFYTRTGIKMAVAGAVARLEASGNA
jgi:capsular polysaccharide export protein